MTFTYNAGRVASITTADGTTTYSSSDAGNVRTVTVTDPLSHATTHTFDIALQRMTGKTDALSHTTSWQYDSSGRITRVTQPEGNYLQLTYDARGNVTEKRMVAKSGSGVADIVTSASYPATCVDVTCNEPTTTTDERGNVTDYTYDTTHGGVLTVTAPAPTTGATRPQTRYTYTSLQAYFNKGSGIVASGEPVYRLTSVSQCQTGATCTGTADEVKTIIDYGPQVAGPGDNLLPVSVTTKAGDSSLSATTTTGYDNVGNAITVDGPLSGTVDTTRYRFDAARQLVGVTSPDPDGAGARKPRAVRNTYDDKGRVTLVETGTVTDQSDTAWAAFTPAQAVATSYDGLDRKLTVTVKSGSTSYSLTQYSYDAAGRLDCSAARMNSATWNSLPASACTLGTTGAAGPDRITKTTYDVADHVTKVTSAFGVTDTQSDDVSTTYSNNGRVASVTDAEGNKTTYEYDGVYRLVKTRYPVATKGSDTSSTTDYQTDPIGYSDGLNSYAYVGADPINATDPSGMFGLFGGCPAGSSCTSTNPAASNAAGGYRNAKLESAIQGALPGISKLGVNQIISCINSPSAACMSAPIAGWDGGYGGTKDRLTYSEIATLVKGNNKSDQRDELVIALIYKESRFDPSAKSSAKKIAPPLD
ncbi:hypothetical protein OMP43_00650 [Sphingomonas sp. CBMAI 2297]|uniref:hypothetical protein n=1 Tax=Sphingomonas sp. CBMAI 2297 TaxID=2991720 RepID=UPI002458DBA6|nr:hypothetical protein [Sphingomonas sp. CBMAI 2297]MDH4742519.1 hypothetical protein [Sphingomonas sp. CBMAI 2297]